VAQLGVRLAVEEQALREVTLEEVEQAATETVALELHG
jgi:hypothetical protein